MIILTFEQLHEIHSLAIVATSGSMGIRDLGRLESAIATQTQNVFGEELFSSTTDKAVALIRAVIADHPSVDGNKRTAMLTGITFLEINGLSFIAKNWRNRRFRSQYRYRSSRYTNNISMA